MSVDFSQYTERVLNDLQRARLSRGRMIRLPPPSPSIVSLTGDSQEYKLLTREGDEGGGRGGESYDRKKA